MRRPSFHKAELRAAADRQKDQHVGDAYKNSAGEIDEPSGKRSRPTREEIERREHDRHLTIFRVAKLKVADDESICIARNLSSGGMMIEVLAPFAMGQKVRVSLVPDQHLEGHIVWQRDWTIGIRFESEIDVMHILAMSTVTPHGCMRRIPRMPLQAKAQLQVRSEAVPVEICDISPRGVKIKAGLNLDEQEMVCVLVEGLDPICGKLRWQLDGQAGIEFAKILPIKSLMQWLRRNAVDATSDR